MQIPLARLMAMKLIVNQAYDNIGLHNTQILGPILDGIKRSTPQGRVARLLGRACNPWPNSK